MKAWKKVVVAGFSAFAVFVALKFTDDWYAELSKSCSFYGGTPAERSVFSSTPSCAWSSSLMQRQINFMGIEGTGLSHAERFCRMNRGAMSFGATREQVVCALARKN
ncbi:hypothetical protein A1D31_35940 [Bradyrhizobium liaoningense]|nr:hypothetical protein A1D31_35940 [Bradyrhizobium liaoningense]